MRQSDGLRRMRTFNVCSMQFLRWEAKGLPPRKANGDAAARVYYKGSDLNDFFGL
jgi:hypothetical protein